MFSTNWGYLKHVLILMLMIISVWYVICCHTWFLAFVVVHVYYVKYVLTRQFNGFVFLHAYIRWFPEWALIRWNSLTFWNSLLMKDELFELLCMLDVNFQWANFLHNILIEYQMCQCSALNVCEKSCAWDADYWATISQVVTSLNKYTVIIDIPSMWFFHTHSTQGIVHVQESLLSIIMYYQYVHNS